LIHRGFFFDINRKVRKVYKIIQVYKAYGRLRKMNLGILLQIAGILLVMTGAILALSKLWKSYFEKNNRMADFLSSIVEKIDDIDKEELGKKKNPSAKDLCTYILKEEMSSIDASIRIRKLILRLSSVEQRFLIGGIGLIVIGSVTQIIGLIVS